MVLHSQWLYLDQNGLHYRRVLKCSAAFSDGKPGAALQGKRFQTRDGWDQEVAWGIRTGELVLETDLSKMECRKNGQSGSETYENHPVYGTAQQTRYCGNKLWERRWILSTTSQWRVAPVWDHICECCCYRAVVGEVVDITEPMVMYYEVETVDATAITYSERMLSVFVLSMLVLANWGMPGLSLIQQPVKILVNSLTSGNQLIDT